MKIVSKIDFYTQEDNDKVDNLIIALPGRGVEAIMMATYCSHFGFDNTVIATLEPFHYAWYSMPNGLSDQKDALETLDKNLYEVVSHIKRIRHYWNVKFNRTVLLGHSAGAVMAMEAAFRLPHVKAVCSLSGTILDPERIKKCKSDTKFILQHSIDDDCFTWDERYLPFKNKLIEQGYNVLPLELSKGGHEFAAYSKFRQIRNTLIEVLGLTSEEQTLDDVLDQEEEGQIDYVEVNPDDEDYDEEEEFDVEELNIEE